MLTRGVQQGDILLSSVYFSSGRPKAASFDLLFNLVCGILATKPDKPVFILATAQILTAELNYLQRMLHKEFLPPEVAGYFREKYPNLHNQVALLRNVHDIDSFQQAVQSSLDCAIRIIPLGRIPQPAFAYLLSIANLVSIFEGAGTASLALNLGKRYIRLYTEGSEEIDFYPCPNLQPQRQSALSERARLCSVAFEKGDEEWKELLSSGQDLPDQVIASFLQDEEMTKFFAAQREFFHSEQNDTLLKTLLHYRQSICPEKHPEQQ
jgi:hypothetical protein